MRMSMGKLIEESPEDKRWNWHFIRICPAIDNAKYSENRYIKFRRVLDRALKNGYPIDFRGVKSINASSGLCTNATLLEYALNKLRISYKVVQALVCDYGADVNIKDSLRRTALMQLCEDTPSYIEDFPIYQTLLEEIIERTSSDGINSVDSLNLTPLKLLVQKHVFWGTEEEDIFDYQRIRVLLNHGAIEHIDEWEKDWETHYYKKITSLEQQKRLDRIKAFLKNYHEQQTQQKPDYNNCCFDYDIFL